METTAFDGFMQSVQTNMPLIVLGTVFGLVLLSVILAFAKKAVLYANFNDLAWSIGMFAIPAVVMMVGAAFMQTPETGEPEMPVALLSVGGGLFLLLFVKTAITTYRSNNGSILLTPILMVGKMALSFLFIFYLYWSLASKTRSERGKAVFVLVILTPIMLALVREHKGVYAISRSGRLVAGKPVD